MKLTVSNKRSSLWERAAVRWAGRNPVGGVSQHGPLLLRRWRDCPGGLLGLHGDSRLVCPVEGPGAPKVREADEFPPGCNHRASQKVAHPCTALDRPSPPGSLRAWPWSCGASGMTELEKEPHHSAVPGTGHVRLLDGTYLQHGHASLVASLDPRGVLRNTESATRGKGDTTVQW